MIELHVDTQPPLTAMKSLTGSTSPWGIFSRIAACFAIVTGLTVLAGWTYDVPALTGLYADITMKANAAICFLACGLSLLLVHWKQRYRGLGIIGIALATVSVLIGGLTLLQHISSVDFGIDQLLFSEPPGALATASPGRMGVNASTSFVLCGLALVSLYRERAIVFRQLFVTIVLLVELIALVGFAYGVNELYGLPKYTGIALHAAIALAILSLGILAAREKEGFMALVSVDTPAGSWSAVFFCGS